MRNSLSNVDNVDKSSAGGSAAPALANGIRVVEAIARDPAASQSINALAARLGIPPASCYRLVRTLELAGWLTPLADGGHDIGTTLRSLVSDQTAEQRLVKLVQPAMDELAATFGVTFKLSARRGDDAMSLYLADPDTPLVVTAQVGARFHLCLGSGGPALLRDTGETEVRRLVQSAPADVWRRQTPDDFYKRLQSVRTKGHCVDRGSYHPDIHAVSVPIGLPSSEPGMLATVTAIVTSSTSSPAQVRKLLTALLNMAKTTERNMPPR